MVLSQLSSTLPRCTSYGKDLQGNHGWGDPSAAALLQDDTENGIITVKTNEQYVKNN
jgi:hypothetical protein